MVNDDKTLNIEHLQEWSRHFDSILWTMSGIVFGILGGLGVYSIDHFNVWVCLAGLIITSIASYLIASFRAVRRQIHDRMKNMNSEIVELIRTPKGFKQWPVVILFITLITILWITLLIIKIPYYLWLWCILGLLNFLLSVYWFRKADNLGRSQTKREK